MKYGPRNSVRGLWRLPVLGSTTSAVLGIARDVVVVWGLANAAQADLLFACLLWSMAITALGFTSTIVRLAVAAREAPAGHELRWWWRAFPLGRLLAVAWIGGVVVSLVVGALGTRRLTTPDLLLAGISAALFIGSKAPADTLNAVAGKSLGIGPVQWCTVLQNVVVLGGAAVIGLSGRGGFLAVLACYTAGFVANFVAVALLLLRRAHRLGDRRMVPNSFFRLGPAPRAEIAVLVIVGIQLGLPLIEQLALARMTVGTITAVAYARRLSTIVPSLLLAPFAARFLLDGHEDDPRLLRLLPPTMAVCLAYVTMLAVAMELGARNGRLPFLAEFRLGPMTALLAIGGVTMSLWEAGSRWLQTRDNFAVPTIAAVVYAVIHLAGIGASAVGGQPWPALLASSLGWLVAAAVVWRTCRPAPPLARFVSPPMFLGVAAFGALLIVAVAVDSVIAVLTVALVALAAVPAVAVPALRRR